MNIRETVGKNMDDGDSLVSVQRVHGMKLYKVKDELENRRG